MDTNVLAEYAASFLRIESEEEEKEEESILFSKFWHLFPKNVITTT